MKKTGNYRKMAAQTRDRNNKIEDDLFRLTLWERNNADIFVSL